MMSFANIEDPWIDYLIISRLGGYYATPIVQFFQDKIRNQVDPQLEPATQPKAQGTTPYGVRFCNRTSI
jgi:predicted esterase YcpF (UPF0227 family)